MLKDDQMRTRSALSCYAYIKHAFVEPHQNGFIWQLSLPDDVDSNCDEVRITSNCKS